MSKRNEGRGPGGVPLAVTSFVGRHREIREVVALVSQHRLVTLNGTGGVGKTRLALEVAGQLASEFDDGVAIVELAGLQDAGLLVNTVAAAFGLRDQASRRVVDQFAEHIANRKALVVLDNCEHLINAAATFVDWILHIAPDIRVLATTRRTFGLGGEHLFTVPPLSIPAEYSGVDMTSDAVELLVDRARAVRADFEVTENNWPAVSALCARLDGLPLAIELAATRLRSMSVEQLAERLRDRFQILTGGSPVSVPRHKTLRALIDWSHDLCTPAERLLWARLSVFPGGFELASAERVCAYGELRRAEILDGIDQLVSQSIVFTEVRDGRFRYRMLETIREYGLERLAASPDGEELRRRHRDYYLELAETLAADWCGPDQVEGLIRLRVDQDNVRAALDFSAAHPDAGSALLRFTGALRYHWFVGGHLGEGRVWLDRALAADVEPSVERATTLWVAAWVTLLQGDMDAGMARLDEGYPLATALGHQASLAYFAQLNGSAALFRGELQQAIDFYQAALTRHRVVGADDGVLGMLFQLAITQAHAGDADAASATCQDALDLSAGYGERWGRSYALWALSFVAWGRGANAEASSLAIAALQTKAEFADGVGAAVVIELMAWIAAGRRDYAAAARFLGAANTIWRHLGTSMTTFGPHFAGHQQRCDQETRQALGAAAYRAIRGAAERLTPAQAIADSLRAATDAERAEPPQSPLTPREHEVADLIARGMSNREIAAHLVVSPRTVDSHVEHIFGKLGFRSRAQLAVWIADQRRRSSLT